jgi:hypothetical protein
VLASKPAIEGVLRDRNALIKVDKPKDPKAKDPKAKKK